MTSENTSRTERAYRVLLVYRQYANNDDNTEAAIGDLIADLLHLAEEYGVAPSDMESFVERAHRHWWAESVEGDDQQDTTKDRSDAAILDEIGGQW